MLGFFPFYSWWGTPANIEQALTLCLAVSFLTLIHLIFDMFTLTDNDEVIDQIITNNREII